ncbi:hypothetical protein NBRC116188_26260 [Oceaniserpentilla sp. 4NH20-0058]|uniref:MalM family protein n=1 Tax=Oceaniserpentilla sp. 4NH20-0058 TaxID=3127660 RepID=UPI0031045B1A
MKGLIFLFLVSPLTLFAEPLKVELNIDFSQYEFLKLEKGIQRNIESPPQEINLPIAKINGYFFELPTYQTEHHIELTSLMQEDQFFYPLILILDKDKNLNRAISDPLRIKNMGGYKKGMRQQILIYPFDQYLVITTPPQIVGQNIPMLSTSQTMIPIGNTGQFSTYSSNFVSTVNLSNDANLYLQTPTEGNIYPIHRLSGWYWDLGISFGGDKVADNTTTDPNGGTGDPYNAGRGAIFGLGYHHVISPKFNLVSRSYAGLRYQGGDGTNKGVILQQALLYSNSDWGFGVGIYIDTANSVKHPDGNLTKFETAAGPALIAEYRATEKLWFGLRFVDIDYKSTDGTQFNGSQGALNIGLAF